MEELPFHDVELAHLQDVGGVHFFWREKDTTGCLSGGGVRRFVFLFAVHVHQMNNLLIFSVLAAVVAVVSYLVYMKYYYCTWANGATDDWVRTAISDLNLSLDPCKIKPVGNEVYYKGKATCVATKEAACDEDANSKLVCPKYWAGDDGVFVKVQEAVDNGGVHPSCPA